MKDRDNYNIFWINCILVCVIIITAIYYITVVDARRKSGITISPTQLVSPSVSVTNHTQNGLQKKSH